MATIKSLWGIAKCPEMNLSKEDLYALVFRETGSKSISELTQKQVNKVCAALLSMKRSAQGEIQYRHQKRTDEGGNEATKTLRTKIYALTGVLGWNDNNNRINGFCYKVCKVQRVEWLDIKQCNKVIVALKNIIERNEKDE